MSRIIGQATCPFCGYRTTTGAISTHVKHCKQNPDNKKEMNANGNQRINKQLPAGFDSDPICNTDLFKKLKFEIASIQFNKLSLSESGTAIEANPATHAIAKYVYNLLNSSQPSIIPQETVEQAAEKGAEEWVFGNTENHWSNNNNEAGDNFNSYKNGFIAGANWKSSQVEIHSDLIDLLEAWGSEVLKTGENIGIKEFLETNRLSQSSSAGVWVRALDRLPIEDKEYVIRWIKNGKKEIGWRKYIEMHAKDYEWLDENQTKVNSNE